MKWELHMSSSENSLKEKVENTPKMWHALRFICASHIRYLLTFYYLSRVSRGGGRISYGWWWYESVCVYLCTCLFNIAHNRNNPPTPHLHSRHIYILYYVRYLPLSYNFTARTCLPYREQLMGVRGCSSIHVRLYSQYSGTGFLFEFWLVILTFEFFFGRWFERLFSGDWIVQFY